MKIKKPKFWDLPKPNFIAYTLLPFSKLLQIFKFFKKKNKKEVSNKNYLYR